MAIKISTEKYSEAGLSDSKFFGEILLEEKLLKGDYFSPTDVFLCALELEKMTAFDGEGSLPKSGTLLFFVDIDARPATAKVVLCEKADALVDFNEDSDCGYEVEDPVAIDFSCGETGTCCLVRDEKVKDDETCLLRFSTGEFEDVDFLSDTRGSLYFIIKTDALRNRDFSDVKVYFSEE